MGKKGGGSGCGKKKGGNGYVHKVTINDRAHESDERRVRLLKKLKVNQLQKHVDNQISRMCCYVPDEVLARKARKIDPQYDLKGAARVAREFYKDPACKRAQGDDIEVDILEKYGSTGRLWEDCPYNEGRHLLEKMLRLAVGLHNVTEDTEAACKVLRRMLAYDKADHVQARQVLLRCYMDNAQAEHARAVIDEVLTPATPEGSSSGGGGPVVEGGTKLGGLVTDVMPFSKTKKRKYKQTEFMRASSVEENTYMASDPAVTALAAAAAPATSAAPACCFHYTLALIEHISHSILNESDGSAAIADAALLRAYEANPFALFLLAYHSVYNGCSDGEEGEGGVLEFTEYIAPHYTDILGGQGRGIGESTAGMGVETGVKLPASAGNSSGTGTGAVTEETSSQGGRKNMLTSIPPGSIEDAISFFSQDFELWSDVDGAVEWVQNFIVDRGLQPPPREVLEAVKGEEEEEEEAPDLVDVVEEVECEEEETEEEEAPSFDEHFDALPDSEKHRMYVDMFYTGLEMAEVDIPTFLSSSV